MQKDTNPLSTSPKSNLPPETDSKVLASSPSSPKSFDRPETKLQKSKSFISLTIREGYLFKLSEKRQVWRSRYFYLNSEFLTLYTSVKNTKKQIIFFHQICSDFFLFFSGKKRKEERMYFIRINFRHQNSIQSYQKDLWVPDYF